ncbi:MAG: Fe(3+) dicitrate transport ATP-binding protein FecE [Marine Group II euryarchaeote MED-G33]|nr:MAG: Fe(3+) dicitrate transport ATP-binding protein FecE [Marine Group II euryarchaeote MED-G33]
MSEILHVENLNFSWGENHVLKDACFSIGSNQIVAILGINGAGKSTLLKCINKILNPSSGEIYLTGNDVKNYNLAQLATKVSYVPQSVMTSFSMDVFDVVLLGRRPHLTWRISDKDRDLVSETLRYLGLEDFAFRRFDQLSGGERQRVIIAKAIAQDPSLILMDEPTSDLDLKNQIEVMKRMKEIVSDKDQSRSALIAIHDINIAARYADRILLLHEGKIIADGTPSDVLTEQNIAQVFGVTSSVIEKTKYKPLRVIIEDAIEN